jgi:hypothetical protein
MVQPRVGSVMVVGGGIAGMQTAVDLAKRFFANVLWVMKKKRCLDRCGLSALSCQFRCPPKTDRRGVQRRISSPDYLPR